MNRSITGISLLILIALLAVGCAAPADDSDGLTPVTFMLDWTPNVNHVGIFVADELGMFEAEGLDVEIIQPGEVYAESAVVTGVADYGVSFQEYVTLLRADDVPLVSIAAVLQSNTSGFAVPAGLGLDSPADFEGLRYGTFNSPFEEPTLNALMACVGGDGSTVEYITAGDDLLALMSTGQIDLGWIYYGTQGFQAEQLGIDLAYFGMNEYTDCIPDYYTPVIVASEETLRQQPDVTKAFLRALSRGYQHTVEDPQDAARILAEAVPELNLEELGDSTPWLADYMLTDSNKWGHQDASVWADYTAWLADVGVLDAAIDTDAAFSNDYLP